MPDPMASIRKALPAALPRRVLLALRRDLTVGNLTERLGSVYGDKVALRLDARSALAHKKEMTFNDVDRAVSRLATTLCKHGFPLGELVAVVPSNGPDFLLTLLAVVRAGGVAVPVNPILKREEIRTLIELSGATTLIGDPKTLQRSVGARIEGVERWFSLGAHRGATDILETTRRARNVMPAVGAPGDTVVAVMY